MKRVKKGEHLLTKTNVIVDDKKNKSEAINNLLLQQPNSKLPLLDIYVKLHIYNLARPNIDSILEHKIYDNPRKTKWKTRLLSKKQLDRDVASRKGFNKWLKRTGEAPVIINQEATEISTSRLRSYYFKRGWLDAKTTFKIDKNENQKATIDYFVEKGKPYILDTIVYKIKSPIIDSLYKKTKDQSLVKFGDQYEESNFVKERERINTEMRNSGVFHFGQEYINYVIDTIGSTKKVFSELYINNREIRNQDSTTRVPFKIYTIKNVNIYTESKFEIRNETVLDSTTYDGFKLLSIDELKYRPKALTDAIFITKGNVFRDIDRTRTYRHLSELQTFRYPNIEYVENEADTTLTANIYLSPKKKYGLTYDFDISQSNIQTIGFSFSTGLKIRNIFRGAETLDISLLGAIGASKDVGEADDAFFDINELGANIKLTIPRMFFPINTERVIPKHMSPSTRFNLSATSQTNIGLDKQAFSGNLSYNWFPNTKVTNTFDLFNIQFVKNLNTANYFSVYNNSFNSLVNIAQDIGYIDNDSTLSIPEEANTFINDVLEENTSLTPLDENFITVNNIDQRKQRLTENNLIFSTSFNYIKNRKENIFDNNFSILKLRGELAGNMLSNVSKLINQKKNANNKYEVFGVAFSQYIKAEVDYIKHWDFGKKNVLAFRSFFGIAIPYGNSDNIPFSKSFFAGGPNDNRAWSVFDLGPGSSESTNEFNEANLKLHFSLEQRFNIFGSLNGALFVDAGNIWNALDNVEDNASTFTNFSSLKDIAIGSGFGFRYDLSFFVVRLDIGLKTYNPSFSEGNRWFNNYNFGNAVYNIGINYPF